MSEAELTEVVKKVIEDLTIDSPTTNMGSCMKACKAILGSKPYDGKELSIIIKNLI